MANLVLEDLHDGSRLMFIMNVSAVEYERQASFDVRIDFVESEEVSIIICIMSDPRF